MHVIDSINELFNNPKLRSTLVAYRIPLTIIFILVLLFLMKPEYFWMGFIISMLGEAIQVWCFASINKNKELSTNGPYAIMRNPMYIGRYLLILGGIITTGSWILAAFYTIIYYFYMVNRVKREEEVLVRIFGDNYKKYCKQVNRFVPTFRQVNWKDILYFKWNLFFKNHAHYNLIAVLVAYCVAYFFLFYGKQFLDSLF